MAQRRRRPAHRGAGTTALLATALTLAGCGSTGQPSEASAPPAEPTSTTSDGEAPESSPEEAGTPDDTEAWRSGQALTLGEVTAWPAPGASVDADDDGSARLTVPVSPGGDAVPVLAVPPDTEVELLTDGSAVLRRESAVLGGLATPTADTDGAVVRLTTAPESGVVEVTATTPGGAPTAGATVDTVQVTLWLGGTAVQSMEWGDVGEGGRSLAVVPTAWARAAGAAGLGAVWEQVSAVEEAATSGMHDQLACHALGAPDKASWNLEPWRPDVGLLATLAALCNPT